MTKRKPNPAAVAAEIRSILKGQGSAQHAEGVQWFFKEEIKSRGWYTADLRRLAAVYRKAIQKELSFDFLAQVADQLFRGRVLEEKVVAVFLLEKSTGDLATRISPCSNLGSTALVPGPTMTGSYTI